MHKIESLLIDKYKLEQKIKRINLIRGKMLDKCKLNFHDKEIQNYIDTYHKSFNYKNVTICLTFFYEMLPHVNRRECIENSFTYEDLLFGSGCIHCLRAFKLKHSVLKDSNIQLGGIKRNLTLIAKKLIKEGAV